VTAAVALPFRVGARTVWRVRRRLQRVAVTLDQARRGELPHLPPLEGDGYFLTSLPADAVAAVAGPGRG
jgi:hypothetical protein